MEGMDRRIVSFDELKAMCIEERKTLLNIIQAIAIDEAGEEEDKLILQLSMNLNNYCLLRAAIFQLDKEWRIKRDGQTTKSQE